ncbi:glycosyltransferase family A protein [Flexibacterium corallicola]|uniref:glycosyltransferase family A protein n=1 Tax=Flexibacterium corallicola TaxID=3037259 RepID=UPI00286F1FD0|nr:glycosyltransferase family A protein [Pseudovibrio sp. M1P-2-3]
MSVNPVCSVIIPTKNCLDYLENALQSVVAQDMPDIEIIVVDDGSDDGTEAFLKEFKKRHGGIVALEGLGEGPAFARNKAIDYSQAKLIAFLDADDIWYPQKLVMQVEWHLHHPKAAFSFTDYRHVNPCGDDLGTCFDYWRRCIDIPSSKSFCELVNAESSILAANIVGTSTVVANSEYLRNANGFATELPSAEDWDLWLKLATMGPVGVSGCVTMDYLMRPGSETQKKDARIQAVEMILERYSENSAPKIKRGLRKANANLAVSKAERYRDQGAMSEALREHLKALILQPDKRTAIAALSDAKNYLMRKQAS